MNTPGAFKCSYSDWKLVKTRGVVQVVFELPLHEADEAYRVLGGMPDVAAERWFGIAPLDPEFLKKEVPGEAPRMTPTPAAVSAVPHIERSRAHPKQAWNDMAPSQQAGILCDDPLFWMFLRVHRSVDVHNSDSAANFVRSFCHVKSRSEIIEGDKANDYWLHLVGHYRMWQRTPEYVA